jgi:hypothetical protein
MRKFIYYVGGSLFTLSGLGLWILMLAAFVTWWGGLIGFVGALFLTPGIVIFPIVYWVVEHHFPVLYFLVWALGWCGLIVAAIANDE